MVIFLEKNTKYEFNLQSPRGRRRELTPSDPLPTHLVGLRVLEIKWEMIFIIIIPLS